MKIYIFTLLFYYFPLSTAQQVVNERNFIKDGVPIKVITTRRGEGSPIQGMLASGHETHKIRLQDSINKSDFEVKYYLEEYLNNNIETEDKALHFSINATYINEVIINRMENGYLSVFMQIPGYTSAYYIQPKEKNLFKWKIFTETPLEKNVPVFLIYDESPEDDILEKNFERLFATFAFKKLKKDEIVEQIKSVANHFYLFFYDVILNK